MPTEDTKISMVALAAYIEMSYLKTSAYLYGGVTFGKGMEISF
jgi:hypothetical protein